MSDAIALQNEFALHVYPMRELELVRGAGAKLWDVEGREYIDCMAANGVANIGHSNPVVIEALSEQAQKLISCPGGFYHESRSLLLQKLAQISPDSLRSSFLCNSGAEAVEAAIKFARYSTGKTELIAAMRGFHGRTTGAVAATFNPKYRQDFEPLMPGIKHVPFNNSDKLEQAITSDTCAILLEPIQGEGGVNIGDSEYLKGVQKLCRERDILLIIDEIQTGFCRTGAMFACEHFGLEPDILCIAKAVAGGLPCGAVVCSDKIKMKPGKHGSTFGGNPLVSAAALASIQYMQDQNLAQRALDNGRYFLEELRALDSDKIREARGVGLMLALELKEKSKPYLLELMKRGVLALPAGPTVLRFLPPLVISRPQIDSVISTLQETLSLNPN